MLPQVKTRSRYPTITVTPDGRFVPWLSTVGPLAYTPESPPPKDYYFQYGWVIPGIFRPECVRSRHYYFGSSLREDAVEAFTFWDAARMGKVDRIFLQEGILSEQEILAPNTIYRFKGRMGKPLYVLIQHGSYQFLAETDQTELQNGYVTLYRGIQKARKFHWPQFNRSTLEIDTWSRYLKAQGQMLSDSILSFNSIHDRASRTETGYLNDRSWCSDVVAKSCGLNIDNESLAKTLWSYHTQSFSLSRPLVGQKFGPNFVSFRTPLTNIRITTFVADEYEARIIDPFKMQLVESRGCDVVQD